MSNSKFYSKEMFGKPSLGWEEETLGQLGETSSGLSGKTKEDFSSEITEGYKPFISYTNVYNHPILPEPTTYVKIKEDERQNKVSKDDFVFTGSSETPKDAAKVSIWDRNEEVYLNSFCFSYRLKDLTKINTKYFLQMLHSPRIRVLLAACAQGSTRYNVSKAALMKIAVPVPPLSIQNEIAEFLSALDERIELQERKIELLVEQKKGYVQRIFNRELRFHDSNGNQYPEWEEKALRDLTYPHTSNLSLKNLHSEIKEGSVEIYSASGVAGYAESNKVIINNYFTIIKDGAGVGRITKNKPGTYFISTLQGITNKENAEIDYLFHLFSYLDLGKDFSGSTIPHIYYKDYSKKKVFTPSLPEQEKIANFLSTLDEQISLEKEKLTQLKLQKQGYMQRIFA